MSTNNLRQLARQLQLGRALYWAWHAPMGGVKSFLRYGGPHVRRRMDEQRGEMIAAAARLPKFPGWQGNATPRDVHFLTGQKYWHETAFCFWSMCHFADHPLRLVLFDDGSLPAAAVERARSIFPHVHVHDIPSIEARLDVALPASKFPTLREWRVRQPLLRKITDLHAGSQGWKLLLDSDMVFLRRPDFLFNWLESGSKPVYMVDVVNAYGFSHELRYSLVQKPIHDRINIGIFGLKSEDVDFERLEHWLTTLLQHEPSPYNLTQGLTSMLLAGVECDVAPKDDYIVLPSREESENPTAVLHHFVAESRRWYYQWGWRHAQKLIEEHA